ncbi:MAG: DUF2341 domain-containing protein [Verrucomicrobiota bacterium]
MMLRMTIAIWLFLAGGLLNARALDPADFTFRYKVSFERYDRETVLTHFPVLLQFDRTRTLLYGGMASPVGGDLRFTDAGGTAELNYEIDTWCPDGLSAVWVQVPTLSSNACIYVYWGNRSDTNVPAYATDGSTWSNAYVAVHHLSASSGSNATDATSNGLDGVLRNMSDEAWRSGILGNGLRFDGEEDYYEMPDIRPYFEGDAATLNVWVKLDAATPTGVNRSGFMSLGSGSNSHYPWLNGWAYLNVWRSSRVDNIVLHPGVDRTQWHMVTITSENVLTDGWRMYQNGEEVHRWFGGSLNMSSVPMIGRQNSYWFDGMFDELRLSDEVRSPDWIWASWINTASNEVFLTSGPVDVLPTNLPVVVSLFSTERSPTGAVIRGQLASTGSASTAVSVVYGAEDEGIGNPSDWPSMHHFGVSLSNAPVEYAFNLNGLSPNTVRCYRYYATNAFGSWWGEPRCFSTLGPPIVDNGSGASAVGVGQATLNGAFLSAQRGDSHFTHGIAETTDVGGWIRK